MLRLKSILAAIIVLACTNVWADDIVIDASKTYWNNGWYTSPETYNDYLGKGPHNVTFSNRTFTADQWDGICLPFDASESVLTETFGAGYEIQELTVVTGSTCTFKKKSVLSVNANTPYLIKVKQTTANPVFRGVSLVSSISSSFLDHGVSSDAVVFRGFYFMNFVNDMYKDGGVSVWCYVDGTLRNVYTGSYYRNENPGANAYFYVKDNSTPTIIIENSSDGGSGGSGEGGGQGGEEGGGTVTPTTSTAQKIASRAQINTCVPTVYIDIYDAEKTADGSKPLEGTKNDDLGKGNFRIYDNSGNTIVVSNDVIANNIAALADARSKDIRTSVKSESYELARITVVDDRADKSVALKARDELTTIRGRGNSTWNSNKKPFRLKFPSKTKLLAKADGTNTEADAKNWTLLANAADKSMIQNALTCELGRRVGLPYNPTYQFVDLVYNGEYVGTYQISDHNQVNKYRVNIDENTGWLLEFVPYYKDNFKEAPYVDITFNNSQGISANVKNPEVENDSSEDPAILEIKDWLNEVASKLKPDSPDYSVATGYKKYVDINSLADYVIVNEITGNFDGTISNYAYREADGKLKFGPIWDNDLSYSNYTDDLTTSTLVCENMGNNTSMNYVMQEIYKDPEFLELLNEKWNSVYGWDESTRTSSLVTFLNNKVDEIASSIACSRELNYTPKADGGAGWGLGDVLVNSINTRTYTDYSDAIARIKDFIGKRTTFLNIEFHRLLADKTSPTDYALDAASSSNASFENWYGKVTNVHVTNRTFRSGTWNAVCLPFGLTEEKLKGVFGNQVELATFKQLNGERIEFEKLAVPELMAGKNYLLKFTGADIVNPTFRKVVISTYNAETEIVDNELTLKGTFNNIGFEYSYFRVMLADGSECIFELQTPPASCLGTSFYIIGSDGGTYKDIPFVVLSEGGEQMVDVAFDVKSESAIADLMPYLGKRANVKLVNRGKLTAGIVNTLCLPFNMTLAEAESTFGAKPEAFTGMTGTENNYFHFDTATSIEAGKGYVITPLTDFIFENHVFENVEIPSSVEGLLSSVGDYGVQGILVPTLLNNDGTHRFLYGSDNKLYYHTSATYKMPGGRAYFILPKAVLSKVNDFFFDNSEMEQGIATDISEMNAVHAKADVYNLNGQRVGQSFGSLPSGIYIVNGKKIAK